MFAECRHKRLEFPMLPYSFFWFLVQVHLLSYHRHILNELHLAWSALYQDPLVCPLQ